MLDNTTKKRIDDCRDVLVGKVPDPKSQIEQITLALIYKFMDDMDRDAVEKLKGKAKFFTGDYEKYGWRKLFDPSLGGEEMLKLYSEALEKLNINPNIPELFRNIFKNAYLPYRDPSTLKLFLKYINEFEYSHSEKLGDAFEYLLSVMGSQGDAGQFRTPRHIIDFVTACVNPQKNETVLDPACGTAGFLLSAYKHILNQNTEKRAGDKLTPDQRKKLATNFTGYDISPDMVRLSLANMYLHGFTTPHIVEYDTLSSEDRWNETYDVILANPPFMTPKGGIRPHKKFGVQANKAEVLFTDYIAEHLNTNGRAGIVVPNGIVATSQTAYKELRRHLVNDSLIAVVSLPAGCFNPYSGVKTSVLLLDKQLSKKSKHILFLKVENDGFDLGAQRREHDKNDLPVALQTFEAFKVSISTGKLLDELPSLATLVEKQTVLGNKDVVLNAERYFEREISQTEFRFVKIGSIADLVGGGTPSKENLEYWDGGNIDWITCSDFSDNEMYIKDSIRKITEKGLKESSATLVPEGTLILVTRVSLGKMAFIKKPTAINQDLTAILFNEDFIDKRFGYLCLKSISHLIKSNGHGATVKGVTRDFVKELEIPLPPLEIQQQIVAEIEGYQKIIDGANQVVNNYKPTIKINPEWEMVELDELCDKITDGSHFSPDTVSEGFPYITVRDIDNGYIDLINCKKINEKSYSELVKSGCKPQINDVLFSKDGTVGKVALVNFKADFVVLSSLAIIRPNVSLISPEFLCYILQSDYALTQAINLKGGVAIKRVVLKDLKTIKIPKLSIDEQVDIVRKIDEEVALVASNKRLIDIFEQKIKEKINEVWGVKEEESLLMAAEPQSEYNK